jgi:hypothetical protein
LAIAKKELDHLRHLEKYYQDSTQAIVFMKSEFQDAYENFTRERHLFTACLADYQEETVMALETYKDVERWYGNSYQVVE